MINDPGIIIGISYNGPSRIQYSGVRSSSITISNIQNNPYQDDYPLDEQLFSDEESPQKKEDNKQL